MSPCPFSPQHAGWLGKSGPDSRGALTSLEPPCRDHLLPLPRLCQQRGREAIRVRWRADLVLRLLLAREPRKPVLSFPTHFHPLSPGEGEAGCEECEARQPSSQPAGHGLGTSLPSVLRPRRRRERGVCAEMVRTKGERVENHRVGAHLPSTLHLRQQWILQILP